MTVRVMVVVLGDGNGGGDVGGSGTGSATTRVLARRSCGTQKLAMCSGLKLFAPGSWFVLMTFSVGCCGLDHSVNGKTDMPMSTTFTQCSCGSMSRKHRWPSASVSTVLACAKNTGPYEVSAVCCVETSAFAGFL